MIEGTSIWHFWNPLVPSQTPEIISTESLVNDPTQKQIVATVLATLGEKKPVSIQTLATTYSQQGDKLTVALVDELATAQGLSLSPENKEQIKTVLGGILKEAIKKANEVLVNSGQNPLPEPNVNNTEIGKNTIPTQQKTDYKPILFFGILLTVVIGFFIFAKYKK